MPLKLLKLFNTSPALHKSCLNNHLLYMFHLQRKYPNENFRGVMLFDPTVYNHRTSITHAEVHSFILTLMLD
jgi:hypothetical protein